MKIIGNGKAVCDIIGASILHAEDQTAFPMEIFHHGRTAILVRANRHNQPSPTVGLRYSFGGGSAQLQPTTLIEGGEVDARWGIPSAWSIAGAEFQRDLFVAVRYLERCVGFCILLSRWRLGS